MALTPPFATASDVQSRWRPLTPDEQARATVLLMDASQQILDDDTRRVLSVLTAPTPTLVRIVCAMVRRAMASPVNQQPTTQFQQTTGPFSVGGTLPGPSGDLYLTKAERKSLGFIGQRAGGVDQWVPPVTT